MIGLFQLHVSGLVSDGNSDSGLRYTQGGAQFPMAHLLFMKVKNK
ncbi:MAG TPA: hypothetical protein PL028_06145 [Bacteroidales bacterium]|nr:hypothetical protein [Bacteroidales bacterium]